MSTFVSRGSGNNRASPFRTAADVVIKTAPTAPTAPPAPPAPPATAVAAAAPPATAVAAPSATREDFFSSSPPPVEELDLPEKIEKDLENLSSIWSLGRRESLKKEILRDFSQEYGLYFPEEWEEKFPYIDSETVNELVKKEDPVDAWEELLARVGGETPGKEKRVNFTESALAKGGERKPVESTARSTLPKGTKGKSVFAEEKTPGWLDRFLEWSRKGGEEKSIVGAGGTEDLFKGEKTAKGGRTEDLFKGEKKTAKGARTEDLFKREKKTAEAGRKMSPGKMTSLTRAVGVESLGTGDGISPLEWAKEKLSRIEIKESLKSFKFWLIFGMILLLIGVMVAIILGGVALGYALQKSSAGPTGPTGPQGIQGLNGAPGPTGPPGNGLQLVFDAYNTGNTNTSVKLALGTSYTIPGLMLTNGVCYNTTGIGVSSSNCFTIANSSVLGVTPIASSQRGGYGIYNMTSQDVTFDLDINFNFAYTYPSSQSAQGPTLTILIQSYILTWNAAAGQYYSSTSYPSASYNFLPQPPCGQFGGSINVSYTERFTLPAASNSSTLGANCGFDANPPLLVVVLSTGQASGGSFLTANQAGALSVKAYV